MNTRPTNCQGPAGRKSITTLSEHERARFDRKEMSKDVTVEECIRAFWSDFQATPPAERPTRLAIIAICEDDDGAWTLDRWFSHLTVRDRVLLHDLEHQRSSGQLMEG